MIGGRYQILATLGQGGMGLVYRAYDPVLDRTIALKKMVASVVDSDERRARFYIEARAAARLNHPNIVTIYELEEHAGDVYIVMELLEGVSLAAFVQKRVPLSLAGYLTILAQIAEGLHYAHERGIVHRDIKPANLALTTSGTVKILDFGIAQLASQTITKAGAMLGTPHYMSPEQIKDEPVDARADLFSLGAVAYELVTGKRPFEADTIAAVLMRITAGSHTPVKEASPDLAPALADSIESLLAKDRAKRPATGAAICQALERLGEIDRVDLVAEAVRTIVGPAADQALFAPITPTPRPPVPTPRPLVTTSSDAITSELPPPPPLPADLPPGLAPDLETVMLGPPASAPSATDSEAETSTWAAPPPAPPSSPSVTPMPEPPANVPPLPAAAASAPPEDSSRAAAATPPAGVPPLPAAPAASAPASVRAAGAEAIRPAAPQPAKFVDTGVPQARTRHGAGVAVIAIVGVLLVAVAGVGWWGYVTVRQVLAKRIANSAPASPSASSASPAATTPTTSVAPPPEAPATPAALPTTTTSATATTPADATSADARPADARPADARPADAAADASVPPPTAVPPSPPAPPASPAPESASSVAPPPSSPSSSVPPASSSSASADRATTVPAGPITPAPVRADGSAPVRADAPTAPSSSTPSSPAAPRSDVTPPTAKPRVVGNASNGERARTTEPRRAAPEGSRTAVAPDAPPEAPRESPREAPRDVSREAPRESEPSASAPDRRQPLDAGSLTAFQRGSRSGSSSGGFYSDAPTTAAAVARITYTLEAYSDAIAKRDIDALREVRSSVTPTEAAWVKDGTTTVRFSNVDVSVDGTEAVARCRRTIVSDGKTRASGAVQVHLARKPSGWVITDIR